MNATTTTRTVLAIIDAPCWSHDSVPESRIVELITAAAERYYQDRDDVTEFEVVTRLQQHSNVWLPADYNKEESKAITNAAWNAYCDAG